MLTKPNPHPAVQLQLFGNDLLAQLDPQDPLIQLSAVIDWPAFETAFSVHYSPDLGRPAIPIRRMVGLLILKSLENLSDEAVVLAYKRNPYYQVFCGAKEFERSAPCSSTELVHFRKRIGETGVRRIFEESVRIHGRLAEAAEVHIDSTVQEKNITYPTDSKLAIKIINRLNKLAKAEGIQQRRSYVKEVKALRLACRHFRHVKRRAKAKKALRRLRTIAGILLRELRRQLPQAVLEAQAENFALYARVLAQRPKDKNKIYALHEPQVYCIGKGKDHKAYEYGAKASVVSTAKEGIILAAVHHDTPIHDSHTLPEVLGQAMVVRSKPIVSAICDRGYRGKRQVGETTIILPGAPLKRDNRYQRDKKRRRCRRRAAIEPLIGHLKSDHRLGRCFLKGSLGDAINLLMAACAWNLKKWLKAIFLTLELPVKVSHPTPDSERNVFWRLILLLSGIYLIAAIANSETLLLKPLF